jgi:hypothetical protein
MKSLGHDLPHMFLFFFSQDVFTDEHYPSIKKGTALLSVSFEVTFFYHRGMEHLKVRECYTLVVSHRKAATKKKEQPGLL